MVVQFTCTKLAPNIKLVSSIGEKMQQSVKVVGGTIHGNIHFQGPPGVAILSPDTAFFGTVINGELKKLRGRD